MDEAPERHMTNTGAGTVRSDPPQAQAGADRHLGLYPALRRQGGADQSVCRRRLAPRLGSGRYLRSTLAFAHLDFAATSHWYPLLYPLAATPFAWLMPGNLYLLLDILCVFFQIGSILRVAAHLGIGTRAR